LGDRNEHLPTVYGYDEFFGKGDKLGTEVEHKNYIDGVDNLDYWTGKSDKSARDEYIYIEDKDGNTLDGSKTYRLNVPANAPARQYWTPTDPKCDFEILFRFYGPLPSLFDKSCKLRDVEPMN
jgi:hypothetical protein